MQKQWQYAHFKTYNLKIFLNNWNTEQLAHPYSLYAANIHTLAKSHTHIQSL